MKVLVTGAAGFIGANLCRELAGRPTVDHVIAIDDLSTGSADNLAQVDAEFVKGSILDRSLLDDAVDAVDAVVHLAALPSVPRSLADPLGTYEVNATGTLQVLEACRPKSAYLVAASSSSVYGAARTSPKHEDLPTRPLSPYAASKIAAEASVLAYGAAFGLPVLALRFFNVYGPLQRAGHPYAAVIPTFTDALLRHQPLVIHGDGRQVRDFTYVATVVKTLADAVASRVTRAAPVNLAFGTRTSVAEVAGLIAAAVGVTPDIRYGPARAGDIPDSQADSGRLREMFPRIQPVGLAEGIAETVSWLRDSGSRKLQAGTGGARAEPAGAGI